MLGEACRGGVPVGNSPGPGMAAGSELCVMDMGGMPLAAPAGAYFHIVSFAVSSLDGLWVVTATSPNN